MLDILVGFARERYDGGHNVLPHILVCERGSENIAYLPVKMDTPLQKTVTARLQKDLAADLQLVAGVILVSEVWQLSVAKDDKKALDLMKSKKGISDNPDRTEALLWSCMRGDMQMMAIANVERPAIGTPIINTPKVFDVAGDGHVGRLTGQPMDNDNKTAN